MLEDRTVLIIIEPIIAPPVSVFELSISRKLIEVGYSLRVKRPSVRVGPFSFQSMRDLVLHVMKTAEQAASFSTEYAGYVLPTVVEVASPDAQHIADSHIVFLAIRNRSGREWIYTRFYGQGPAPQELFDEVALATVEVLTERQSVGTDIDKNEFSAAQNVILVVASGVEAALRTGVHAAPGQSM